MPSDRLTPPQMDRARLAELFAAIRKMKADPEGAMRLRLDALLNAVSHWRRQHQAETSPAHRTLSLDPGKVAALLARLSGSASTWRRLQLNVWNVAGLWKDEVRTTRVLAWALDCRGSHGLGNAILKEVFTTVAKEPANKALGNLDVDSVYTVQVEHCAFADNTDRVDVVLTLRDAVIVIEAKIDSIEGPKQLSRYMEVAAHRAKALRLGSSHVLYLTRKSSAVANGVTSLTWSQVARAVKQAVRSNSKQVRFSDHALLQFADHCASLK